MGKIDGFLLFERQTHAYKSPAERVRSFDEFTLPLSHPTLQNQAARCMDCGIPYCHQGCPVNNIIPEFNDLIYKDDWRAALENLHKTNNFPEFTGRICPAPCEAACTLNLIDQAVTIKDIECAIVDYGWQQGWITPQPPKRQSGKRVAIIGSGPAGLACAQQLARSGIQTHVYEKQAAAGGLLRYGIPDFKMNKSLIDRRIEQMQAEGVQFYTQQHIDASHWQNIKKDYDAIVLACGAETPRDLPIPGRTSTGIHFAMDYLTQQNKRLRQEAIDDPPISAKQKHVIVIGGGDTGSDCIGTANRQQARSITQLEILATPPQQEAKYTTWPYWPHKLRTSTSQQEGVTRIWATQTKTFLQKNNHVTAIEVESVDWNNGKYTPNQQKKTLAADLVLLAMGFLHTKHDTLLNAINPELDSRGNIKASDTSYHTSVKNVFACGDARRGQSLVVWAIREGRQCAQAVEKILTEKTKT